MELRQIVTGKTDFMDLLLLGDEQEDMVMKYLERGEMAALFDGEDAIALSVVTKEGENLWELKNIAVLPAFQGKTARTGHFAGRNRRNAQNHGILHGLWLPILP